MKRGCGGWEMKLNQRRREVILALAENDMNVSRTARKMYLSVSCVRYHIGEIRRGTGLDPRKFYDLVCLADMARNEEAARP